MIAAHNTAQQRQTAIVNALGLTASPSPLSEQLSDNATQTQLQLQNASATEFDVLYIRSQVDMHLQVLQAIDEQLLPNVSAETLRAELVLTRTDVAAHLESARALLATFDGTDASDAGAP
jgi:putative membrane protein